MMCFIFIFLLYLLPFLFLWFVFLVVGNRMNECFLLSAHCHNPYL